MAVIPDFLTVRDEFIRFIPSDQMFNTEIWLVTHADLVASARVRAAVDFGPRKRDAANRTRYMIGAQPMRESRCGSR